MLNMTETLADHDRIRVVDAVDAVSFSEQIDFDDAAPLLQAEIADFAGDSNASIVEQ